MVKFRISSKNPSNRGDYGRVSADSFSPKRIKKIFPDGLIYRVCMLRPSLIDGQILGESSAFVRTKLLFGRKKHDHDDPWWSMMIHDDSWWSMVIHDDPWWSMMIHDGPWWSWWSMMIHQGPSETIREGGTITWPAPGWSPWVDTQTVPFISWVRTLYEQSSVREKPKTGT